MLFVKKINTKLSSIGSRAACLLKNRALYLMPLHTQIVRLNQDLLLNPQSQAGAREDAGRDADVVTATAWRRVVGEKLVVGVEAAAASGRVLSSLDGLLVERTGRTIDYAVYCKQLVKLDGR